MTIWPIILSLLIGISVTSIGLHFYYATYPQTLAENFPNRCIMWIFNESRTHATRQPVSHQFADFTMIFDDNNTNIIECFAQFAFDPIEIPPPVTFILYFPYQLHNLTGNLTIMSKTFPFETYAIPISFNLAYNQTDQATRITANIETWNTNFLYYIKIWFLWKDFLLRLGLAKYRLLIPFSFFTVSLTDRPVFDKLELIVVLPKGTIPVSFLPEPDSFFGPIGGRSFYWNLTSIPLNPSVSIDFEVLQQKELYERLIFWSGILIGLGIPLLVSGFIESLRFLSKSNSTILCRKRK
jgi:hypothetical protein